jgi:uncharacterized protein
MMPPDSPAAAPADGGDAAEAAQVIETHRAMLEALICPLTQGPLTLDAARAELHSRRAGLAYPIRAGIPIMLESEARPLD